MTARREVVWNDESIAQLYPGEYKRPRQAKGEPDARLAALGERPGPAGPRRPRQPPLPTPRGYVSLGRLVQPVGNDEASGAGSDTEPPQYSDDGGDDSDTPAAMPVEGTALALAPGPGNGDGPAAAGGMGDGGGALAVVAVASAEAGFDGCVDARRHARQERWANTPWSLAPVFSGGEQIGWGASCGRHANAGGTYRDCKRQLAYGLRNPLADSECRCKLKSWLLKGAEIGPGPNAKDLHFAYVPRHMPLEDEAVLDARAAALQFPPLPPVPPPARPPVHG